MLAETQTLSLPLSDRLTGSVSPWRSTSYWGILYVHSWFKDVKLTRSHTYKCTCGCTQVFHAGARTRQRARCARGWAMRRRQRHFTCAALGERLLEGGAAAGGGEGVKASASCGFSLHVRFLKPPFTASTTFRAGLLADCSFNFEKKERKKHLLKKKIIQSCIHPVVSHTHTKIKNLSCLKISSLTSRKFHRLVLMKLCGMNVTGSKLSWNATGALRMTISK